MNRQQRHAAILRILREHPVSTQTELADALHAAGHDVVQTTVSRDIHELGLIKIRGANGDRLLDGLAALPGVTEVRGAGLLVGAVLDRPAGDVVDAALDAGLVCLTAGPNVLRLAPPLVVGAGEIDNALEILTEVLA